jgi:hypothetical protein
MMKKKQIDHSKLYDSRNRLRALMKEKNATSEAAVSPAAAQVAADVSTVLEGLDHWQREALAARQGLADVLAGLKDRRAPALVAMQLRRAEKTIRKQAGKIRLLQDELIIARAAQSEDVDVDKLEQQKRADAIVRLASDAVALEKRAEILRGILNQIRIFESPPTTDPPPAGADA